MKYYQEISLSSDSEISLGFIWHKVYQQIHIGLVENKIGPNKSAIGLGFPEYGSEEFPLGRRLRIFSMEFQTLEKFNIGNWLQRLMDFVTISDIKDVPQDVTFHCYTRQHVKSAARIEKDMLKKAELWSIKSGKSLEDCIDILTKTKPDKTTFLPYVYLESQETKRRESGNNSKFPIFIKEIKDVTSLHGIFDCYGLSSKSNLPSVFGIIPHF